MLVRLSAKGSSWFVEDTNTAELLRLKDNFGATPELDSTGKVRNYTMEEFRRFIGLDESLSESVEDIFDIKHNTEPLPVVKPSTVDK